jgi:hypothetical protein
MNILRSILILTVSLGIASASSAQTYDALADFSTTQNPNGVWTYAYSTNLAGPLYVYPDTYVLGGAYDWGDNAIGLLPHVAYNPLSNGPVGAIPANCMLIHPGPENQFSHCVWTAPTAGAYNIQASFTSISYGAPHGYILENGTSIGDSDLTEEVPQTYSFASVALAAGDTIDAAIGVGSNNYYSNDETVFSLTITGTSTAPAIGPAVPGIFRGLINGTSGPGLVEGEIRATVGHAGGFSGQLHLEDRELPIEGIFSNTGHYSTVIGLNNETKIPLSLNFSSNGTLTGTGSYGGTAFSLSAGAVSNTSPAGGRYTFTMSPGQSLTSGSAPEGTGFGYMEVHPSGEVSIVGTLGNGTTFAT